MPVYEALVYWSARSRHRAFAIGPAPIVLFPQEAGDRVLKPFEPSAAKAREAEMVFAPLVLSSETAVALVRKVFFDRLA